jgi:hypothetical protein
MRTPKSRQVSEEIVMSEKFDVWKQTRREFLDRALRIAPGGLIALLAPKDSFADESQRTVTAQSPLSFDREAIAKRIEY